MTHYSRLGVQPNATDNEIRAAYLAKALRTHPDREPEQKENFIVMKAAYDILSDPIKRKEYDDSLEETTTSFSPKRPYTLQNNPEAYNHYAYTNLLFELTPDSPDYHIPGQSLSSNDANHLWWQLHTIAVELHKEERTILQSLRQSALKKKRWGYRLQGVAHWFHYDSEEASLLRHKEEQQRQRLDFLNRNEKKIGEVEGILTSNGSEKLLYDLSLGAEIVAPTAEMNEIEQLIGGRKWLVAHIKVHPQLYSAGGILALHQEGCLNPANFKRLIKGRNRFQFADIANILCYLLEARLLNQANFDRVLAQRQHASPLSNGIRNLSLGGLLTQSSFEELLQSGSGADNLGFAFKTLNDCHLLNDTNRQMVHRLVKNVFFGAWLNQSIVRTIDQRGLTAEDSKVLLWTGSQSLHPLSLRIDEMFAYGLSLLSDNEKDQRKADTAMVLALDLKKSLQTFFAQPLAEQRHSQHQFKVEFKQLLHSQDELMTQHRAYWKIVIANVAIASTILGSLVLAGYYLHKGHCFFHQTKRENLRDAIEHVDWLQEESSDYHDPNKLDHQNFKI